MAAQQRTLFVFTRLPRMGAGKRRLAADIGAMEALRFQRTCLGMLIRRLGRDRRWTTIVALTPVGRARWPVGVRVQAQPRGDLGERMTTTMQSAPAGPVVLVGSDIPGIRPAHIAAAFAALGRHGAVLGPASDGGFWLIGLRRRPRFVDPFQRVRWSTPEAGADTLANLTGLGCELVATLDDIDTGADYRSLARRAGGKPC